MAVHKMEIKNLLQHVSVNVTICMNDFEKIMCLISFRKVKKPKAKHQESEALPSLLPNSTVMISMNFNWRLYYVGCWFKMKRRKMKNQTLSYFYCQILITVLKGFRKLYL
jgi:hypothetical protein